MKLTAITATWGRPEAFALCQLQMAAQTRQPDQWLVLDGPEPMHQKVLDAIDGGRIEGEMAVFFEDDDCYGADWLEWCEKEMEKGFELIGEGNSVYYHVANRWWSECRNCRHAALCQTAIHADLYPVLSNVIKSYRREWFDTRIWEVDCSKSLFLPSAPRERRVVGIKGMPGQGGYSGEHRGLLPEGVRADPACAKLHEWIGDRAERYLQFDRRKRLTT